MLEPVTLEVSVREMHLEAFHKWVEEQYQPHMVTILGKRKIQHLSEKTIQQYMVLIQVCDVEFLWSVARQWESQYQLLLQ